MQISRRRFVIAGGSFGIGAHIAKTFAAKGAVVYITGRDQEHISQVTSEINHPGSHPDGVCHFGLVDLADQDSVKDFAAFMRGQEKSIECLINAIGGAEPFGAFQDLSDEDWYRTIDLNLMSVVRFTREFVPMLRESREATSSIINISSLPSHQPGRFNPHYAAAKAGVDTLSKMLSLQLAPKVRVNVVRPSTIVGGGWERNIVDRARRDGISETKAEARMFTDEARKTPLERPGTLDEVVSVVEMLATNEFMTGQFINIDGGQTRTVS